MNAEHSRGVRWLDHDADLLLEVTGSGPEDVFAIAGMELARTVAGNLAGPAGETRRVSLAGKDAEDLFVAWMNEILYIITVDRFHPARVASMRIGADAMEAEIVGGPRASGPESLLRDVKAATYHDLFVGKREGRWVARVLFDV